MSDAKKEFGKAAMDMMSKVKLPLSEYSRQAYELTELKPKKKSWPERHWLVIAIFSFVIGFGADILKEVVLRKIYPEKTKTETQAPISSDTTSLRK